MSTIPDLVTIRDAYAAATADDGHWHHKDYLTDLEDQKIAFDAWLREHDAEVIDRLADKFPLITRDMVSRGDVRNWLLHQADLTRNPE